MSHTQSLLPSEHTEDGLVAVADGAPALTDYILGEKLGEGGNATVYRAQDRKTGATVAVKLIHKKLISDERFLGRFQREVRAATSLSHEHICRVYAAGETSGDLWLAMELIDGGSLNELIERHGALPPQVAAILFDALLAALEEAHKHTILHRDIKPHNVMITSMGCLKLVDFGIARSEGDAKVTETGFLVGTPAYMSPEQVTGRDIDHRSDLYAAGLVAFEMLTDTNPYARHPPSTAMLKIATESLPPLSELDHSTLPSLESTISTLMHRLPDERPKNAAAARTLLAPLVSWIRSRHDNVVGAFIADPIVVGAALRAELAAVNVAFADALLQRGPAARPAALLALARAEHLSPTPELRARLERLCVEGTFVLGAPPPRVQQALDEALAVPGNASLWRRLADVARAEGHLPLAVRGLRRWLSMRDDPSAALQLRKLLGDGEGPPRISGLSTGELVVVKGAQAARTQTGETPLSLQAPRSPPPSLMTPATGDRSAAIALAQPTRSGPRGVVVEDEAPFNPRWLLVAAGVTAAVLGVFMVGRLVEDESARTQRMLSENIAAVGAIEENDVGRRDDNVILDMRTDLARGKADGVIRSANLLLGQPELPGAKRRDALYLRAQAYELLDKRRAARSDYIDFLDIAPVTDDRYALAKRRIESLGAP